MVFISIKKQYVVYKNQTSNFLRGRESLNGEIKNIWSYCLLMLKGFICLRAWSEKAFYLLPMYAIFF